MIHAEQDALVEYLPDPVILFPQARYATRLDLTLDPRRPPSCRTPSSSMIQTARTEFRSA